MRCINCGSEMSTGAKFCRNCGQNQQEPASGIPNIEDVIEPEVPIAPAEQQASKFQMPDMSGACDKAQEIFKNAKKIPMLLKIAVPVVLVLAVAIGVISSSPEATVLSAAGKTVSAFESGFDDYMNEVDLLKFFDGVDKDKISMTAEAGGFARGNSLKFEGDLGKNKFKGIYDISGDYYELYMSEQSVAFSRDDKDNAYGISLKTLEKDLENTEISYFDDMEVSNVDINVEKTYDKVMDIYSDALIEFVKDNVDVEKDGKSDFKINGEKITATTYCISANFIELVDVLEDATDDVFDLEEITSIIESYEEFTGDRLERNLHDIVDSYIYDAVSGFANLTDDGEFYVHIYKGAIAAITSESRDTEVELLINPVGNVFENISLKVEFPEDDDVYIQTLTSKCEDDKFLVEFSVEDGRRNNTLLAIDYDMGKTKNNFDLVIDGDEYTFDVDMTEKNVLNLGTAIYGVTANVKLEKNNLAGDWFTKGDNFINLLKLTEDEFYDAIDIDRPASGDKETF